MGRARPAWGARGRGQSLGQEGREDNWVVARPARVAGPGLAPPAPSSGSPLTAGAQGHSRAPRHHPEPAAATTAVSKQLRSPIPRQVALRAFSLSPVPWPCHRPCAQMRKGAARPASPVPGPSPTQGCSSCTRAQPRLGEVPGLWLAGPNLVWPNCVFSRTSPAGPLRLRALVPPRGLTPSPTRPLGQSPKGLHIAIHLIPSLTSIHR